MMKLIITKTSCRLKWEGCVGGISSKGFWKEKWTCFWPFQKENKLELANMFTIYFLSKVKGVLSLMPMGCGKFDSQIILHFGIYVRNNYYIIAAFWHKNQDDEMICTSIEDWTYLSCLWGWRLTCSLLRLFFRGNSYGKHLHCEDKKITVDKYICFHNKIWMCHSILKTMYMINNITSCSKQRLV